MPYRYPLLSNPNKHYYTTRSKPILGIVLHVTAGAEDTNMVGPDGSAEGTIRYGQTTTRPASWHGIVDSDSVVDCLPDGYTAFHVRGYNSPTLGLEIANRDAKWDGKPADWIRATLGNAAAWCKPRVKKYGLPVKLSTKAEVDAAVRAGRPFGFTYHSWLDPARRIDPGRDFPIAQFLGYVRGDGPPAGPVKAEPGMGQYPVQAGDTLMGIAEEAYGDPDLWTFIFDSNPKTLRGSVDLAPGMTLWLPADVPEEYLMAKLDPDQIPLLAEKVADRVWNTRLGPPRDPSDPESASPRMYEYVVNDTRRLSQLLAQRPAVLRAVLEESGIAAEVADDVVAKLLARMQDETAAEAKQ